MNITQKNITVSLLKAILKICIAGVFIGLLHNHEKTLALILFLKVIHSMYDLGFKNKQKYWLIPIGMCFTCITGMSIEYWGTINHYWEYHNVLNQMPLWLPLAWMLSFSYIYKLERNIFTSFKELSLQNKLIIALLIALIFPAFGEVITIYLGVWTYYLPYQLLGVPLYALVALTVLHLFINIIIYYVAQKFKIKDPVFNNIF